MLKKQHLIAALFLLAAWVVMAGEEPNGSQAVELNPSHPDVYVVQKGDTLWDISARFLKSPWLWPEVWHANPQIKNPHLIYPGDRISLVYVDGQPQLYLERGHPTVKLGPKAHAIDHNQAIPAIPLDEIKPFLEDLRILSDEQIDTAPYVVALEDGHVMGASPYHIYVRNLNARPGAVYTVAHPTVTYYDVPLHYPWEESEARETRSKEWRLDSPHTLDRVLSRFWKNYIDRTYWENVKVLGHEVADIATATVVRTSKDVTTLKITDNKQEVRKGDLILPPVHNQYNPFFFPKPGKVNDNNVRIVALNNAIFRAGKRQVVAINRGSRHGIQVGDVFQVNRPEKTIRDEVKHPKGDFKALIKPSEAQVTLPEESVGHVMVFRTTPYISYAIVTEGKRGVKLYDYVRTP